MAEKYKSNDFLSSIREEDEIDLGKIFRFLLMQSKLILSIVFVALILSCSYFFFATKQYEVKSLIQYEAFDQNIFDPSQSLRFASGANATSDITDMIQLYESRTNYLKVIKDLKLNIRVEGLEDDEDVNIYITSGESDLLQTQKLKFSFSENGYSLLDDNLNEVQKSDYGQQILFNGLKLLTWTIIFSSS